MDHSRIDQIHISDLKLECIIGINPQERIKKQEVLINIVLYADLSSACSSDSIDETVDYKKVHDTIVQLVEGSSYFLVEKLADRIAHACLSTSGVEAVRVRVEKPQALQYAKNVGVEIYRE